MHNQIKNEYKKLLLKTKKTYKEPNKIGKFKDFLENQIKEKAKKDKKKKIYFNKYKILFKRLIKKVFKRIRRKKKKEKKLKFIARYK